mmetsp:Transcript_1037/g.2445  ORF Transcript_1037/g.2445 Transcript_1037/m.2445 type:complete len:240 (+) Transcript_1037:87-806(+)|eukprot:CAMPEP_0119563080 /NCGR_PEP_ID=MMETSP1352-20130426/22424_1 /TAXON_ID=265584 /ORGANISM="Stauroneis constricta, Strain CCMP1120" /LENGTH=239 /DNA_ID=CAMNT_0007611621 /DNA_START=40 /DNA_END=759 /DNA_ORIENTATION=-
MRTTAAIVTVAAAAVSQALLLALAGRQQATAAFAVAVAFAPGFPQHRGIATRKALQDGGREFVDGRQHYDVEVTFEGMSCDVRVNAGESILSALERAGAADRLAVPSLPSDCRRGNCMTCSARHREGSHESSIKRGSDGLSPYISEQVEEKGFILTCSSEVVGDGVKLILGEHDDVWQAMFHDRFEEESMKYEGRKAVARLIRRADEENVPRWTKETETALEKSEDETTPGNALDKDIS